MSQQQHQQQPGPPYAPRTAGLGGLPAVIPDVPICAVLLAIYVSFAATNMTIYQLNNRKGHKFIPSVALFGFCMARVTTLVLRIAWATRQTNIRLSIAANILVNAGILAVYILNLIFAQRILRAKQPRVGWSMAIRVLYRALYVATAGALIMVITAVTLSVYTLDPYTLQACRDVQLASSTFLLVLTTVPIFVLAAAYLLPKSSAEESFGTGSMRSKALIVFVVTCLCITNSGFRSGTAWMPPRPSNDPAWYHGKAPFYVFNFVLEILILCILVPSRIDKRFHIPNGSKQAGDYSGRRVPSFDISDRDITRDDVAIDDISRDVTTEKEVKSKNGNDTSSTLV
ncbi:hypothetical protein GGR52DRAFT_377521 [Hypoxylon sp. FL1284]|nr:hypothetical protein GGR52DRAFT_377521 [Hypoxylon sp. FL1284]